MQQTNRQPEDPIHSKPVERSTFIHTGTLDTGWHHHEEYQLIYAEGGILYVLTAESQFLLPAYHGAWIPAQRDHKLISTSQKTRLWLLYFPPQEDEHEEELLQSVRTFCISSLAREMVLFTERWSKSGTIEGIRQEAIGELEAIFYATIRLLAIEWCKNPLFLNLPVVENGLLGEITKYIVNHLEEPLGIESVAQEHGVSGRTLMRLFRGQLGITFGAYLRMARIVRAVELLTEPSYSVLEVSYAVGYSSPSSFSQAFRKLVGMSPQAYAARNRQSK